MVFDYFELVFFGLMREKLSAFQVVHVILEKFIEIRYLSCKVKLE